MVNSLQIQSISPESSSTFFESQLIIGWALNVQLFLAQTSFANSKSKPV